MDANNCPHCDKDRRVYFICCDKGTNVVAGKSPAKEPFTDDEINEALDMMVEDGVLDAELDDEGIMTYRLSERGELIRSAKGKPVGQA